MKRGIDRHQERDPALLLRDTRTLGMQMHDFFQEPRNASFCMIVAAVALFFFPSVADLLFFVGVFIFIYSYTRQSMLPFRIPKVANLMDYNDKKAGSTKPQMSRGICFYGNEEITNQELWFNNDDMRTHTLIFGSTGSGKTEFLISLAYNALVMGSGFIYVDGKGDNSLFSKIFSLARSVGREDDLLLINFMTGARDIVGQQEKRLSNTLNPFCLGSSSMLSQLIVSLMDSSSNTPDGDMWKGRAISFVEALMKILVYMRDDGKILLDANSIRNYFELPRLEAIVVDKMFPRNDQEPVNLADVPSTVLEPLNNYLINLPGYNKAKKGQQVSQVLEQHGFITMQLTRVFTSLADTYGHILRTELAEVDLKDVVLNRRILVVLLPALEKSPDELANLGKIIISTLRSMMASGLGEEVEGEYKDIIERKPTNSPTPYMCILDEYGYYAVPGFAVVPAQARALGFSVIFAGQDLPAFQKASKEEAASIGANTNIKIAMKLEDPIETWDFFAKTAGETYVTKVDSFQTDPKSVMNSYLDTRSASSEKRARIDLLDLKDQREGEMHIFFKSTIVRAKVFYASPPPVKKMRLNQFIKVSAPPTRQLIEFEKRNDHFEALIEKGELEFPSPEFSQDISTIADSIHQDKSPSLIERGVTALLTYYNQSTKPEEIEEEEEPEVVEEVSDELNVFTKVQLSELSRSMVQDSQWLEFSDLLLQKLACKKQVAFAERLLGKPEQQSSEIASELIRDMEIATRYPPAVDIPPDVPKIVEMINELSQYFEEVKSKENKESKEE